MESGPGESSQQVNHELEEFQAIKKISLTGLGAAFSVAVASIAVTPSQVQARDKVVWKKVELPIRETLFDISFDQSKPEHGWIVGSKGSFLETFDGGNTWNTRSFTNLDEDVSIKLIFVFSSFVIASNTSTGGN